MLNLYTHYNKENTSQQSFGGTSRVEAVFNITFVRGIEKYKISVSSAMPAQKLGHPCSRVKDNSIKKQNK